MCCLKNGDDMISKRCIYCGKRVPVGKRCSCIPPRKYKPSGSGKYSAEVKRFYQTAAWEKARERCIAECCGLDIYSLFANNRIEYGRTVHHIVPIIDDYSLRLSPDNLIYLTESNHRIIHELYKTDYSRAAELLRGYVKMFKCLLFLPQGEVSFRKFLNI